MTEGRTARPLAERRKRMEGTVTSNKMDKTIVVEVVAYARHRLYKKAVKTQRKHVAHDPGNGCEIGDRVVIEECRPLSKRKRWRLREVVRKAEISPEEEAAPSDTTGV